MRFRKLRIAWSVEWALVYILLLPGTQPGGIGDSIIAMPLLRYRHCE